MLCKTTVFSGFAKKGWILWLQPLLITKYNFALQQNDSLVKLQKLQQTVNEFQKAQLEHNERQAALIAEQNMEISILKLYFGGIHSVC